MMNSQKMTKLSALMAIGQGVVTAVAPSQSVKFIRKMIGKNFENAEALEAKPTYIRQLRALGIGLAAAGIARFAMEAVADDDAEA